jgi:ABC-type multidrug transport system fused ATPase/permease subunit
MEISRIKLFFEPVRAAPWRAAFTLIHTVAVNTLGLALIEVSRRLVDGIGKSPSQDGFYSYAWAFCGLSIAILILWLVMNFFNSWHQWLAPIRRYAYAKYMRKYLLLNNEDVAKYGVGRMIPLIQKGVEQWFRSISFIFRDFGWLAIGYISGILYIGSIDIRLAGISVAFTFAMIVLIHLLNKGAIRWRKFRRDYENHMTRQLVIMIMEKFTILKNGKIEREIDRLGDLSDRRGFYGYKTDIFIEPLGFLPDFLIQMLKLLMIVFMGTSALHGNTTAGDVAAILLVTGILSSYITQGATVYKDFTNAQIDIEALWDTFDAIPSIEGYDTGKEFEYRRGAISLSHVAYGYGKEKKVWTNFSLDIPAGKKIAIVGRSGVGKSTLIKLVLGFVRPESGTVSVDGQNLAEVNLASYYRHVGYLSQEPAVFDGTIYENLAYGLPGEEGISSDDITMALDRAQCEFVANLPQGLDTEI